MGRVALAKIIILARLLYFFSALPLVLSKTIFAPLSNLLTDLIWGGGRRRVSLAKTHLPLEKGRMGVPQFELYYAAAQIHWIMTWIEDPLNSEDRIVNAALKHSDMQRWLVGRETLPQRSNILLKTADRIWRRYVIAGERPPPYSPRIPLTAITGADKISGQLGLANWVGRGIQTVAELFEGGRFLPYEVLADTHTLGRGEFITHSIVCYNAWYVLPGGAVTMSQLYDHCFTNCCRAREHNLKSLEYTKYYPPCPSEPQSQAKARWETALRSPLNACTWTMALTTTREVSWNARFRFTQFNYLHQTYLTPVRINRMFPQATPGCPRCRCPEADFYHMTWSCSPILSAWHNITAQTATWLGLPLSPTPKSFLLDVTGGTNRNIDV
ncbi:uncharacterized protein [Pleurodeles waltl]|uniref:uncharacterized protein n=1 Tax=Pleurodeles waltl TaxID=8319 RepID=UPI003709AF3A